MTINNSNTLNRIALFCAIFSTISWIGYILASTGGAQMPPLSEPGKRLDALQSATGIYLTYGWAGTFGAFLTIPYLFAIVHSIPERGAQRWVAFLFGAIGSLLTAMSFMGVSLATVYFVLPQILENPDFTSTYLISLDVTQRGMEVIWFFGSFLAYGLAITWIAFDCLKARRGPVWLNLVGIVGGVSGIIWLRPFLDFLLPFGAIGSIANIVLLSTWAIGMTLVLWRRAN